MIIYEPNIHQFLGGNVPIVCSTSEQKYLTAFSSNQGILNEVLNYGDFRQRLLASSNPQPYAIYNLSSFIRYFTPYNFHHITKIYLPS